MRRLCALVCFIIFSCSWAKAQESFFCDEQGTKLNYERHYVSSGELKWRHQMAINEVYRLEDGRKEIEYSSQFTKPSGATMYAGPIELSASITSLGDVSLDLAASLKSVFENYLPDNMVSAECFISTLPSEMKPGDKLADADFSVSIKLAKYRVTVDRREVVRVETITTPAGEFDCVVVREHKIEKGPGRNRETTAYTWYSHGIGMVRHDTYDKNMNLETTEQLCSITR